jgi:hypothetical protein
LRREAAGTEAELLLESFPLGNQLALDFLHTRPVEDGEPIELLPDFAALVRWVQVAGVLTAGEAQNLL